MGFKPSKQQGTLLLGGSAAVAFISAAATLAAALIGFPAITDDGSTGAGTVELEETVAASWRDTPATIALTGLLQNPPRGWKANGDLQSAVVAPLPYSCPVQNSAASTSLARAFTIDGHRVRVTVQAYTAGLGAEALAQMHAGAQRCAGTEGAVAQSPIYGADKPGPDAAVASVSHGGQRSAVASFRSGDVIAFVSGQNSQVLVDAAVQLKGPLDTALQGVCADISSTPKDASRSPFSLAGYSQFTRPVTVRIPDVGLPSTDPSPSASPSAPASPQSTQPSEEPAAPSYPVPAPVIADAPAEPMAEPDFPVWPLMPEALPFPEAPKAPASEAPTARSFPVPADDKAGPGCGWSFTGQKAPGFDADAALASEKQQSEQALKDLKADAKTWQGDVLAYWKSYDAYKKDAEKYKKYAAEVAETNRAWSAIVDKWDKYYELKAEYDEYVAERDAFLERRDAARAEYDEQVKACLRPLPPEAGTPLVPEPGTDTPAPDPSPSASPSPSATQLPAQERRLQSRPGCPAEKPEILSEAVPLVPKEPLKPADPRP
ncbi:hypothetical protein [Arthrobacter sp. IK3]|uniref:hypothetical protein n=1 Tax=Arthrobacter sp. IK3 TaxID=3448169 RepID=UPI003EE1D51D